jgi:hypothetical protein
MTPTTTPPVIDEGKLNALLGRFVEDFGAAVSFPLIVIGERLGLFRALADGEPVTPAELAERVALAQFGEQCEAAAGGVANAERVAERAALPLRAGDPRLRMTPRVAPVEPREAVVERLLGGPAVAEPGFGVGQPEPQRGVVRRELERLAQEARGGVERADVPRVVGRARELGDGEVAAAGEP